MSSHVLRKIVPLGDRVIVKKILAESKTASGVFLPQAAVQAINQAEVISVGKGSISNEGVLRECSLKAGDKVIVPEFGGLKMKIDNDDYICFREDEIVGTFRE
jgi:chaperonin GroES